MSNAWGVLTFAPSKQPNPLILMPKDRSSAALVLAFAAVYLIWGSTYLAIRYAIETLPPFTMIGARFFVAGWILYAVMRMRGEERPPRLQWIASAKMGALMLTCGTGLVAWAEHWVPSGLAALLITTTPVWMVMLDWLWLKGERPSNYVFAGLVLGVIGVLVLIDPATLAGQDVNVLANVAIIAATISWSVGSLLGRSARLPANPFTSTALQMIMGGATAVLLGGALGEWGRIDVASITLISYMAWLYLVVFGSIIAFTAYVWLLRNTTSARASTYAFVNPIVAVILGWAVAGETLNLRIATSGALLLVSVALVTVYGRRRKSVVRSSERASSETAEAIDPNMAVE